jgi:hypothetical protein
VVLLGLVTPRRGVTDGRGGMVGGSDWFTLLTPPPPPGVVGWTGRFFLGKGMGLGPPDLLVVAVDVESGVFLSMVR